MNNKERTIQALRQLGILPHQVFQLYGSHTKTIRQTLVWAITGDKQPIAKCGYNRVLDLLFAVFEVDQNGHGCRAGAERKLEEAIAGVLP